jgi:hypothetical protein
MVVATGVAHVLAARRRSALLGRLDRVPGHISSISSFSDR